MSERDREIERNFNILKALVKGSFTCALKIPQIMTSPISYKTCFIEYRFQGGEVIRAEAKIVYN
jgi:hypothetical protein